MSSESIYFQCVVEYACDQIWLGKDPLYWLTRIGGLTNHLNLKARLKVFINISSPWLRLDSVVNAEMRTEIVLIVNEMFAFIKTAPGVHFCKHSFSSIKCSKTKWGGGRGLNAYYLMITLCMCY